MLSHRQTRTRELARGASGPPVLNRPRMSAIVLHGALPAEADPRFPTIGLISNHNWNHT